jgi:hypothetical protein
MSAVREQPNWSRCWVRSVWPQEKGGAHSRTGTIERCNNDRLMIQA